MEIKNIESYSFRNKKPSWRHYTITVFDNAGKTKYIPSNKDKFKKAYLSNYILRPSCYKCQFKGNDITSDITIGDFWGIEKIKPEFEDKLGVSIVILNTEKGKAFFEECSNNLISIETDLKRSIQPGLISSAKEPYNREKFITLVESKSFNFAVRKYLSFPAKFTTKILSKKENNIQLNETYINSKCKDINLKDTCCGCGNCEVYCPVNAISMEEDKEGFKYPKISNKCINCGLCLNVCPITKKYHNNAIIYPRKSLAVKNVDDEIREKSSSGGIFYALATNIIRKGGTVYGASMQEDLSVKHIGINTINEIQKLQSSKYIQSDIRETVKEIKESNSSPILFTGTACQIAALQNALIKPDLMKNIITVNVICHGVSSFKLFKDYIKGI